MKRFALIAVMCALVSPLSAGPRPPLTLVDDGKTLTVRHFLPSIAEPATVDLLRYNMAEVPSQEKSKPYYGRSGFIHPVYTPHGKLVTGDQCPDHRHQHAIWFAWTSADYDGRHIDFWNSHAQQGRIEHVEVLDKQQTAEAVSFKVRMRHLDVSDDDDPREVLREDWTVRVHSVNRDTYLIDLESRQSCATDKPVVMKQYHYGGMGYRAPMPWNAPAGDFLTSDGKTREDGNHTRPRWVDASCTVDGQRCGVTVMQHPSNFRYPQPVRLHPKFTYFCFAPMVLGDFSIEPGEPYISRYRYVIHDGPADKRLIEEIWKQYQAVKPAD